MILRCTQKLKVLIENIHKHQLTNHSHQKQRQSISTANRKTQSQKSTEANHVFKGNSNYHLYRKKWPSNGAVSGTSSVVTVLSGRRRSTYGVSSQPTMGISEGRCTRSTLSMLYYLQSSQNSNPNNENWTRRPTTLLAPKRPRVQRRIPGGSAIYLTRIPASLNGPKNKAQKITAYSYPPADLARTEKRNSGSCGRRNLSSTEQLKLIQSINRSKGRRNFLREKVRF